jgi:hypothetical protein
VVSAREKHNLNFARDRTSSKHCTFREHIFTYVEHHAGALLLNLVTLLGISFQLLT